MSRRRWALGALVLALALAGCGGPQKIPASDLNEDATYDWDTETTVAVDVSTRSYTAVVSVNGSSSISVFERDSLGSNAPVRLRSLRFRYPNGTVVNASAEGLSATLRNERTEISLPAERGQLGYTADRNGKEFATPVFTDGSYSVRLPPNMRVGVPLLSAVSPGGYETSVTDNRMTVRWEELDGGAIRVRYYLQRDLLIFGGLLAVSVSLAAGGAIYYLRQIRRLRSRREELGLDIDYEDDPTDDGPPPGMR